MTSARWTLVTTYLMKAIETAEGRALRRRLVASLTVLVKNLAYIEAAVATVGVRGDCGDAPACRRICDSRQFRALHAYSSRRSTT
jgi:hypothetical protein